MRASCSSSGPSVSGSCATGVSAAGSAGDQAHRRGELRLGAQQLLGLDQCEQLRRLVPSGLGDVALDLSDDGLQGVLGRGHATSLAPVRSQEEPQRLCKG